MCRASRVLIDTFRDSGVTCPIHVVPLGISEVFHQCRARIFTCTEENPFTILAIADRAIRKNWVMATQAFSRVFGMTLRYRLLLKSRTGVMNFEVMNPNIEIIAQDYTDEEQAALYHRAHLMLFPSRGEGFGFPPREFAATGVLQWPPLGAAQPMISSSGASPFLARWRRLTTTLINGQGTAAASSSGVLPV